MNTKNKNFEQAYFLFGMLVCCFILIACTTKTVELVTSAQATTTPESEPVKLASTYFVSDLDNEDLLGLEPHIAKDSNGNEMAVWEEYDGTRFGVWAKYRAAPAKQDGSIASLWERSIPIDAMNKVSAYNPQVQFDTKGDAVVVWEQSNGLTSTVWTNRYTTGKGWGLAHQIETQEEGNAQTPQIAISSNNLAIVVWKQSHKRDPMQFRIHASRQNADLSWSKPVVIDTNQGNSSSPKIVSDANGNALAVWHTFDGVHNKIKASYFTLLNGWTKASSVETSYSDAYEPRITLDAKGNAIAVWHQLDGSRLNFWANRYISQAGWGQAKLVKPDLSDGDFPVVNLDHFGNAALASN